MKHLLIGLVIWTAALSAQSSEKMSIAFRDPSRPGTLKMSLLYGSIHVKVHAGKDVVVESETRPDKDRERDVPDSARGLKRINSTGSQITLEEENNVVTVSMGWRNRAENVVVLVPAKTSLKLSSTNGKSIVVEGVDGEMELSSTNGAIEMKDVSGSVVAHALNGKILANFKRVDADKPMSFSSMNGTIDVTLPAALKANIKMQTGNGEVFTDFDVQMKPSAVKVEKSEATPGERSRNRVRMESLSTGTVNGGGPDYSFKNFNGNIYIRKGN